MLLGIAKRETFGVEKLNSPTRRLSQVVAEVDNSTGNSDVSSVSSVSSDGDDGVVDDPTFGTDTQPHTSIENPRCDSLRRSIFSKHWKGTNPTVSYSHPGPLDHRSKSPKCVLMHSHFRLYAAEQEMKEEDEEASINTYEQMLMNCETSRKVSEERGRKRWRPYESRPMSSWFTSLPTLVLSESGRPRTTQSDTALHKNSNLAPVLRKGRYSGTRISGCEKSKNNQVSFESVIQVHPFAPPLDQWAEKGWSNWFGV